MGETYQRRLWVFSWDSVCSTYLLPSSQGVEKRVVCKSDSGELTIERGLYMDS